MPYIPSVSQHVDTLLNEYSSLLLSQTNTNKPSQTLHSPLFQQSFASTILTPTPHIHTRQFHTATSAPSSPLSPPPLSPPPLSPSPPPPQLPHQSAPWRITFDTNPDDCNLSCIMCEEHSIYSKSQEERKACTSPPSFLSFSFSFSFLFSFSFSFLFLFLFCSFAGKQQEFAKGECQLMSSVMSLLSVPEKDSVK
jgi:hypothetical protein